MNDSDFETIDARLQCIMKTEGVDRWRAQFYHGIDRWFTLYAVDIALLAFCGAVPGFIQGELRFRVQDQPLVQVIESKNGSLKLGKVWIGNSFVSHEESVKPVTQKAISQEVTISFLTDQVDKLVAARTSSREELRKDNNIVLTVEDQHREEAEVYNEVLLHVDTLMDKFGKVMLTTLWRYRQSGVWAELPSDPGGVVDAIRSLNFRNRDYTISLGFVVDRIFPEVQEMINAGTPFLDPSNNMPITVDELIIRPGLIQKLTKSSEHYGQLIDRDSKQDLLSAIVTETAAKVKALRDGQSKVTNTVQTVLIPVMIEPIPDTTRSRITIESQNDAQMGAILKALKPLVGDISQ